MRWHEIVAVLPLQAIAMQLAKQTVVKSITGHRLTLGLAQRYSGLCTEATKARLQEALSQQAGRDLKLSIEIDTQTIGDTPAAGDARRRSEQLQAAEQLIQGDPNVQALQSRFNASIRAGSIQPLNALEATDTVNTR
jgi:DNA polymerase-3 subunit gamma/tau